MPLNDFLAPYGAVKYESGTAKTASVATLAALKALAATDPAHVQGNVVLVDADRSEWTFSVSSTLTGDDIFVVTPTNATGRWLRKTGYVDLRFAFTYATADAAILGTLPTGARFKPMGGYWEVTTGFTGGSSSAIGISSSNSTGHTTKGDLLGGSGGDVAATLVAGYPSGTIGADIDAGLMMVAADTVRFDRITSAFTAGAGAAHLVGFLVNPGA
jgi:hypothetical protein